jgi:hypothetical protein
MSQPRLSLVPSRAATRQLFLLSILAGVTACSSAALHPANDGGPGTGGVAGQFADAGPDSPIGAGGMGVGGSVTGAGGGGGFTPTPPPPLLTSVWQILNPPALQKADVLFMVDNSQSMLPLQSKLLTSFAAFANTLKALPGACPICMHALER